jgi:hypothetical protein
VSSHFPLIVAHVAPTATASTSLSIPIVLEENTGVICQRSTRANKPYRCGARACAYRGSVRVCWGGSRGRSEFLEIVGSVCGQVVDDGTLHILAHEQHAIHVQVPTARFLNDLRGGAPRFLPWPRPARPLPQRGGHMTQRAPRQAAEDDGTPKGTNAALTSGRHRSPPWTAGKP